MCVYVCMCKGGEVRLIIFVVFSFLFYFGVVGGVRRFFSCI